MTGNLEERILILLLGAAVWPGGVASSTLARRIAFAKEAARQFPGADILCSGGVGRHPPSEARVMLDGLSPDIDPHRIHLDEASTDTLDTAIIAARFFHDRGYTLCLTCTDRYHQPRTLMMLRILGVRCRVIEFSGPAAQMPKRQLWKMRGREVLALPYDAILIIWHRLINTYAVRR